MRNQQYWLWYCKVFRNKVNYSIEKCLKWGEIKAEHWRNDFLHERTALFIKFEAKKRETVLECKEMIRIKHKREQDEQIELDINIILILK